MTSQQKIDDKARSLVGQNVHACLSTLIYGLQQIHSDLGTLQREALGIGDEDEMMSLAYADVTADDFRDAADSSLDVVETDDGWRWTLSSRAVDPEFPREMLSTVEESGECDEELEAWREAFDAAGLDHPDGREAFEHWAVDSWFADRLETEGERIVRDFAGFRAIWARTTTGQAIYADHVIQRIAESLLD